MNRWRNLTINRSWGLGLLLVGLAAVALWSSWRLADSQAQAQLAADDLVACQRLARNIQALRQQSPTTGDQERASADLSTLIDHAATSAAVPPGSIVRISPEPPRPLEQSPFQTQDTQVKLSNLSLRQTIVFLCGLGDGDAGLQIRSLHLTAPRGQDTNRTWAVDVDIRRLVYAPDARPK